MTLFTREELEEMINAISQKAPSKDELTKIPLRPPKIAKVSLSPLEGKTPAALPLTNEELERVSHLSTIIEVYFGTKKISLQEIAKLDVGSLLSLNELCDDLVTIHINGIPKARGEIVTIDGHFGVRIVTFID